MIESKKAVFAGSFDPFTCAHAEIVRKALQIFPEVIVAIADDTGRARVAPIETRVQIAQITLNDFDKSGREGDFTNHPLANRQPPTTIRAIHTLKVVPFSGLLTDFMAAEGAQFMIRGLRDFMDLKYEQNIAEVYKSQNAKFEQIYFLTGHNFMHISGTIVRELAALGGNLDGYVAGAAQGLVRQTYGERITNNE